MVQVMPFQKAANNPIPGMVPVMVPNTIGVQGIKLVFVKNCICHIINYTLCNLAINAAKFTNLAVTNHPE
jgi:hypothetical protein